MFSTTYVWHGQLHFHSSWKQNCLEDISWAWEEHLSDLQWYTESRCHGWVLPVVMIGWSLIVVGVDGFIFASTKFNITWTRNSYWSNSPWSWPIHWSIENETFLRIKHTFTGIDNRRWWICRFSSHSYTNETQYSFRLRNTWVITCWLIHWSRHPVRCIICCWIKTYRSHFVRKFGRGIPVRSISGELFMFVLIVWKYWQTWRWNKKSVLLMILLMRRDEIKKSDIEKKRIHLCYLEQQREKFWLEERR